MINEGLTKILNFMTSVAGVLVQGRDHIGQKVNMHHLFLNLLTI